MDLKSFCQSCSMPLDNDEISGTEKDGSKSKEYCKYCYTNGAFINPDMTLDGMKIMVKTQMEKRNLPSNLVDMALASLPTLKRWKKE